MNNSATLPRYRRLSNEELQNMESEFVSFLIINGITADEWIKIKENKKTKAEELIIQFSDLVLHRVLEKVKFIECRSKTFVKVFQCLANEMVLVAMECENKTADFLSAGYLKKAMSKPPKRLKVYTQTKKYLHSREEELFNLLVQGGTITDYKLFKALCMSL